MKKKSAALAVTTSVFVSGNSQAVRLPKEFRVHGRTLEIFKRGDEIVLRERAPTIAETLTDLPALSEKEAIDLDAFTATAKSSLPEAEDRDFSWIGEKKTRAKTRATKRVRVRRA